jgi:O-antigen/teichoic acid export membrane protein
MSEVNNGESDELAAVISAPGGPAGSGTSLVRQSLILSLIMLSANVANVVFQVVMCRMLSKSDYGVMMVMVGIIYILNVPAESFRTVMAFFAAGHREGSKGGDPVIAGMYAGVMRRLLVLSAVILVLLTAATPLLIGVFHLEGPGPLLASALVCISVLVLTTFQGVLQGTERFGWYGITMNLWFWGRVVFSALLVWLGFRATGALVGMVAGALLGVLLPRVLLHERVFSAPQKVAKQQMRPLYRYTVKVVLMYTAFMVLANMDVIAVKHWFDPERAGVFAQGAMLAHLLWLVPLPIVMAMFPKVVVLHENRRGSGLLLLKAMGVSLLAVLTLALLIVAGGGVIYRFLFGADEHIMTELMPRFLGAMLPVSLIFVLMNFDLARKRIGGLLPLVGGIVVIATSLAFRHDSLAAVIEVVFWGAWMLLGLQGAVTLWGLVRQRKL